MPDSAESARVSSISIAFCVLGSNFHPEGLVAQALAGLPADAPDLQARVRLLMAAFDPCVPFDIPAAVVHDSGMETQHA